MLLASDQDEATDPDPTEQGDDSESEGLGSGTSQDEDGDDNDSVELGWKPFLRDIAGGLVATLVLMVFGVNFLIFTSLSLDGLDQTFPDGGLQCNTPCLNYPSRQVTHDAMRQRDDGLRRIACTKAWGTSTINGQPDQPCEGCNPIMANLLVATNSSIAIVIRLFAIAKIALCIFMKIITFIYFPLIFLFAALIKVAEFFLFEKELIDAGEEIAKADADLVQAGAEAVKGVAVKLPDVAGAATKVVEGAAAVEQAKAQSIVAGGPQKGGGNGPEGASESQSASGGDSGGGAKPSFRERAGAAGGKAKGAAIAAGGKAKEVAIAAGEKAKEAASHIANNLGGVLKKANDIVDWLTGIVGCCDKDSACGEKQICSMRACTSVKPTPLFKIQSLWDGKCPAIDFPSNARFLQTEAIAERKAKLATIEAKAEAAKDMAEAKVQAAAMSASSQGGGSRRARSVRRRLRGSTMRRRQAGGGGEGKPAAPSASLPQGTTMCDAVGMDACINVDQLKLGYKYGPGVTEVLRRAQRKARRYKDIVNPPWPYSGWFQDNRKEALDMARMGGPGQKPIDVYAELLKKQLDVGNLKEMTEPQKQVWLNDAINTELGRRAELILTGRGIVPPAKRRAAKALATDKEAQLDNSGIFPFVGGGAAPSRVTGSTPFDDSQTFGGKWKNWLAVGTSDTAVDYNKFMRWFSTGVGGEPGTTRPTSVFVKLLAFLLIIMLCGGAQNLPGVVYAGASGILMIHSFIRHMFAAPLGIGWPFTQSIGIWGTLAGALVAPFQATWQTLRFTAYLTLYFVYRYWDIAKAEFVGRAWGPAMILFGLAVCASAHKRFPTSPNAGDKEYVGISIILATVLMGFWGVRSWAKSLQ